ncbi:MAG: hypothetical protein ACLQDM_00880 [Bradyrhizobium sp.]
MTIFENIRQSAVERKRARRDSRTFRIAPLFQINTPLIARGIDLRWLAILQMRRRLNEQSK